MQFRVAITANPFPIAFYSWEVLVHRYRMATKVKSDYPTSPQNGESGLFIFYNFASTILYSISLWLGFANFELNLPFPMIQVTSYSVYKRSCSALIRYLEEWAHHVFHFEPCCRFGFFVFNKHIYKQNRKKT